MYKGTGKEVGEDGPGEDVDPLKLGMTCRRKLLLPSREQEVGSHLHRQIKLPTQNVKLKFEDEIPEVLELSDEFGNVTHIM